jgi:C-terminal processing protease CtpA/Prc
MDTAQIAIDATTLTEIVQSLSERLRTCYVFPDVAEQICARLQKHLEGGDYADIDDGESLALALTIHVQEVNQDEHLWVRWHPEPLPDEQEALRQNQEWAEAQRQAARLDNYGLHKVERLPGNVGYVDIRYFHRPAWGGETAVAAMNFLANTHALIIDLRQCPGGYPGMVALLSSYLFGEEAVHLNSIYWRDDDVTQQYWTLPFVPGKRFGAKPVYVLISKDTFSGAEEFAYNLQTRQRATVVGEKTDGGAHPGASYRLHPHFEAFIPVGRAINPLTHTNWEGSGVVPDVSVPREQALKVAYRLALESIIESLGEATSGPLSLLLKEAQAALDES